jgi:hypothetical protein
MNTNYEYIGIDLGGAASHWSPMAWTKLQYSREQVNAAGRALVAYLSNPTFEIDLWSDFENALPVINNWRSSHSFPLNTFRVNLNRAARRVDGGIDHIEFLVKFGSAP